MASNTKTALVLMLLLAVVMAAHADGTYVSIVNEYCKPITVNTVVAKVGEEVSVALDTNRQVTIAVEDISAVVVSGVVTIPKGVTKVAIVQDVVGLVGEVVTTSTTPVGSLLNGVIAGTLTTCISV